MWHEDANRSPHLDARPRYTGQERRLSPRIETPFPIRLRSIDIDEQRFEERTILDNLSSGGLYVRLARQVQRDARLFILIRISATRPPAPRATCIALYGMVARIEPLSGGVFGTAIRITHHHFI